MNSPFKQTFFQYSSQCGHTGEPINIDISEKKLISQNRIFFAQISSIDFTHQIQKEFSKFNHFYACSVKMRFGKKMLFQLELHIEKQIETFFLYFRIKTHSN